MKLNIQKFLDLYPECNPFESDVWSVGRPISKEEVQKYLEAADFQLHSMHPLTLEYGMADKHEKRVAYLAAKGWDDAIEIDVGVPETGQPTEWPIYDGHHRLAAAIFLNIPFLNAVCSGSIDYFEQFVCTDATT